LNKNSTFTAISRIAGNSSAIQDGAQAGTKISDYFSPEIGMNFEFIPKL
jgi:hypothetical protein